MAKDLGILDFALGILEFILGILEFLEIASVALLPRNDGDLMRLLRSLCSLAMTQGILEFPKLKYPR